MVVLVANIEGRIPLYAVCSIFFVFFKFGNKLFSRVRVKINPVAVRMRVLFTKTRFPATGVVGIIHDVHTYPWISMDVYNHLWIARHMYARISKDIHGYTCI